MKFPKIEKVEQGWTVEGWEEVLESEAEALKMQRYMRASEHLTNASDQLARDLKSILGEHAKRFMDDFMDLAAEVVSHDINAIFDQD